MNIYEIERSGKLRPVQLETKPSKAGLIQKKGVFQTRIKAQRSGFDSKKERQGVERMLSRLPGKQERSSPVSDDMRDRDLEHPDISAIERTGHPKPYTELPGCPGCGAEIEPGQCLYEIDGELYCEECFKDWARDYLSSNPREVAGALNVEYTLYQEVS